VDSRVCKVSEGRGSRRPVFRLESHKNLAPASKGCRGDFLELSPVSGSGYFYEVFCEIGEPTDAADALFIKNSIFHNSFSHNRLQLDFSRKTKYFLKLGHAIDYTRV
jgi:hypothetical protein